MLRKPMTSDDDIDFTLASAGRVPPLAPLLLFLLLLLLLPFVVYLLLYACSLGSFLINCMTGSVVDSVTDCD